MKGLVLGAGAGAAVAVALWRRRTSKAGSGAPIGARARETRDDGDVARAAHGEGAAARAIHRVEAKAKAVSTEEARIAKMIEAAGERAPPAVARYVHTLAPYLAWTVVVVEGVVYAYVALFKLGRGVYVRLPIHLIEAGTGGIVCFFGGMFPTLIAASEAFTQSGWAATKAAVADLCAEAEHVLAASAADDAVDADGDGVADVDQISGRALLARKTRLVLTTVDPDKIDHAAAGLSASWIAVSAVLKLEFARTIALAVSIGEHLRPLAAKAMVPVLSHVLPPAYHRWINVTVNYSCKAVGVWTAWYVQRVVSAYHSAIRGGLLCTRALLAHANRRGLLAVKHDETMLDEYAGWALAAGGFYFQFKCNFALPAPFNLLLWPFVAAENYIQWKISGDLK